MTCSIRKHLWILCLLILTSSVHSDDALWQATYDARERFYEKHFGPLPDQILKMSNLFGIWPGGGLFVIESDKQGDDLWVYTSFGLSNPDMPAMARLSNQEVRTDSQGRVESVSGTLASRSPMPRADAHAGYGYEMLMITREEGDWPLSFIQWSVNAEVLNDAGILGQVDKHRGLTVEAVPLENNEYINVLITRAQDPFPAQTNLPNGSLSLLIATVITDEEMKWSMEHGREKLLQKLMASGMGQVSDRNRKSVNLE